jgi:hypothetical protein
MMCDGAVTAGSSWKPRRPVGLSSGRSTRNGAHVAIEEPNAVSRCRAVRVIVRERQQIRERETLLEEPQALLHDGDVGGRVLPVEHRATRRFSRDGLEHDRYAGPLGEPGK